MTKTLRQRIYEEAKLNLRSPYLVTSMRVFEERGYIHSVMPLIRGRNLSDILCCGDNAAESDVIHLGILLASAACDMHRSRLLFTDIKPENIIVLNTGKVKMIDLTCFERIGERPEISLGTEPYAAPELVRRDVLSPAVDVYSIGMVLYEALVGPNAFGTHGFKPQLSTVSRRFPETVQIIATAIAKKPQKRYQTAEELLNSLEALEQKPSPQYELSVRRHDGTKFVIPPGLHVLGRNELAPQNFFISEKQFEFNYDGELAQMRDIANKNQAYLDNMLLSHNWLIINNASRLEIADLKLKFNLKEGE